MSYLIRLRISDVNLVTHTVYEESQIRKQNVFPQALVATHLVLFASAEKMKEKSTVPRLISHHWKWQQLYISSQNPH